MKKSKFFAVAVLGLALATPNVVYAAGPQLFVPGQTVYVGDPVDLLKGASARDEQGRDLTGSINVLEYGGLESNLPGTYWVVYRVIDAQGRTAERRTLFTRLPLVQERVRLVRRGQTVTLQITGKPFDVASRRQALIAQYSRLGYVLASAQTPNSVTADAGRHPHREAGHASSPAAAVTAPTQPSIGTADPPQEMKQAPKPRETVGDNTQPEAKEKYSPTKRAGHSTVKVPGKRRTTGRTTDQGEQANARSNARTIKHHPRQQNSPLILNRVQIVIDQDSPTPPQNRPAALAEIAEAVAGKMLLGTKM